MGNKLVTQTATADYYLHDLEGLVFVTALGDGRVLKSLKCTNRDGIVVVKVYVKRPPFFDLSSFADALADVRQRLSGVQASNVFPCPRWVENEKAGYLIQQFFAHNLEERIGTRPFLRHVEKLWLAFQLLKALEQTHAAGVTHGDIKCENVMVTSWNWLYLTDFSALWKPALISEDEISHDFSFYFDTSGTRTCCLAPERIYASASPPPTPGKVTDAHDVFAAGCVIAQLFLDGTPLFTFSQLLSYRKGELDLDKVLSRIQNEGVRALVRSMTALDPAARHSAAHYLAHWHTEFQLPHYLPHLHRYVARLMLLTPDQRVAAISEDLAGLVLLGAGDGGGSNKEQIMAQARDAKATSFVAKQGAQFSSLPAAVSLELTKEFMEFREQLEGKSFTLGSTISAIDDLTAALVERVETEEVESEVGGGRADVGRFEGMEKPKLLRIRLQESEASTAESHISSRAVRQTESGGVVLGDGEKKVEVHPERVRDAGRTLTVVMSVLCSCMRDLSSPSTTAALLDLFATFSFYVDDVTRLQRIIPYTLSMVAHPSALVRAVAVCTVARVLAHIRTFSSTDSHVFSEYILPALAFYPRDPQEIVRLAFASNVARLAHAAMYFLQFSQTFRRERSDPVSSATRSSVDVAAAAEAEEDGGERNSFDSDVRELHAWFKMVVNEILRDDSCSVRCAFLPVCGKLGRFFGPDATADFLLPRLISILNEREWELRCAFFDPIVSIGRRVGDRCCSSFIFPCIVQGLRDDEEFVVAKTLDALAKMCSLRMFGNQLLLEIVLRTTQLLCHPNLWIRAGAISVLVQVGERMPPCDHFSILLPLLRPFLLGEIASVTQRALLDAVRPPIEKALLDHAIRTCRSAVAEQASASSLSTPVQPPSASTSGSPSTSPSAQPRGSLPSKDLSASKASLGDPPQSERHAAKETKVRLRILLESHGLIPQSLLRKHRSLVVDAEDPLVHLFSASLTTSGVTGAAHDTLLLMFPHVRTAASNLPVQNGSAVSASAGAVHGVDEYMALSAVVPVHSVTLPFDRMRYDTSGPERMPESEETNWQTLASARCHRTVSALDADIWRCAMGGGSDGPEATPGEPMGTEGEQSGSGDMEREERRELAVARGLEREGEGEWLRLSEFQSPEAIERVSDSLLPPPLPNVGRLSGVSPEAPLVVTYESLRYWRPSGLLMGTLHEHTDAVNRLVVSDDNRFFVSASSDGTVKLWDCQRLEKNVTNRSRLTHSQRGRVKGLSMIEFSHSVVAGASTGALSVLRADHQPPKKELAAYTEWSEVLRPLQVGAPIVAVDHFNTSSSSVVVYVTAAGEIGGWDIRTGQVVWRMSCDPRHGVPQCLALDRNRNWLTVGTSRSFYECWDIRFTLPLSSWRHPVATASGIVSLCTAELPTKMVESNADARVWASAGDNHVYQWELGTGICRQMVRVLTTGVKPLPFLDPPSSDDVSPFHFSSVDASPHARLPARILERVSGDVAASSSQSRHTSSVSSPAFLSSGSNSTPPPEGDDPMSASVSQDAPPSQHHSPSQPDAMRVSASTGGAYGSEDRSNLHSPFAIRALLMPRHCSYLLTAGAERSIRLWDVSGGPRDMSSTRSTTVCGLDAHGQCSRPTVFSSQMYESVRVFQAELPPDLDLKKDIVFGDVHVAKKQTPYPSPLHRDDVTDLAVIEHPVHAILSASRDGAIKVWK